VNDKKSPPVKMLRRKDVEERTGLKRSTIYDHVKRGTFPRPIQLGPKVIGWIESEVDAWIDLQIELTRTNQAVTSYVPSSPRLQMGG
jgi:prophage regulatory protein